MWSEFLYVILAYYDTIEKREVNFEIWLPLLISILSLVFSFITENDSIQFKFINDIIPFIGILLGFTLAALTLLLSNNKLETETMNYDIGRKVRGKNISMNQYLVILFSYIIIGETLLCILFYIAYLFPFNLGKIPSAIANTIFIFGFFHILFATLRMVSNIYHITIGSKRE